MHTLAARYGTFDAKSSSSTSLSSEWARSEDIVRRCALVCWVLLTPYSYSPAAPAPSDHTLSIDYPSCGPRQRSSVS
jgi:hypothetical protein